MKRFIVLLLTICVLLTGCQNTVNVTPTYENESNVGPITEEGKKEKPIKGKDVTMLTNSYFEATLSQGNGFVTDYVDDDKYTIYIETNTGDQCFFYQDTESMYAYALAIDTDGGTSTSGVATYSGEENKFNLNKKSLSEKFESELRPVFDKMKYKTTRGHDWVYTYDGKGDDQSDVTKQKVTVYVDYGSKRVSKIISPYICYNFRYSNQPIEQVYTLDDIKSMGESTEVESPADINNMVTMFMANIIKYDEEYIKSVEDAFKDLQNIKDNVEGLE